MQRRSRGLTVVEAMLEGNRKAPGNTMAVAGREDLLNANQEEEPGMSCSRSVSISVPYAIAGRDDPSVGGTCEVCSSLLPITPKIISPQRMAM